MPTVTIWWCVTGSMTALSAPRACSAMRRRGEPEAFIPKPNSIWAQYPPCPDGCSRWGVPVSIAVAAAGVGQFSMFNRYRPALLYARQRYHAHEMYCWIRKEYRRRNRRSVAEVGVKTAQIAWMWVSGRALSVGLTRNWQKPLYCPASASRWPRSR